MSCAATADGKHERGPRDTACKFCGEACPTCCDVARADERAKVAREEVMIYARAWDEVSDEVFEKVNAYDQLCAKVEADRADLNAKIEQSGLTWPIDHEQVDAWASERVALNRVLALFARGTQ